MYVCIYESDMSMILSATETLDGNRSQRGIRSPYRGWPAINTFSISQHRCFTGLACSNATEMIFLTKCRPIRHPFELAARQVHILWCVSDRISVRRGNLRLVHMTQNRSHLFFLATTRDPRLVQVTQLPQVTPLVRAPLPRLVGVVRS